MTAGGEPVPGPRPVSPFLILLLGGAATALGAEWLRFQWTPAVAAAPAALGTVATLSGVVGAYRSRRVRRRGSAQAAATPATAAVPADAAAWLDSIDSDGDDDGSLRIHRVDPAAAMGAHGVGGTSEDGTRAGAAIGSATGRAEARRSTATARGDASPADTARADDDAVAIAAARSPAAADTPRD